MPILPPPSRRLREPGRLFTQASECACRADVEVAFADYNALRAEVDRA